MYDEKPPVLNLKVDDNHFVDCFDYSYSDNEISWKCFLFKNEMLSIPPDDRYGKQVQSMRGFISPEESVLYYKHCIDDGDFK